MNTKELVNRSRNCPTPEKANMYEFQPGKFFQRKLGRIEDCYPLFICSWLPVFYLFVNSFMAYMQAARIQIYTFLFWAPYQQEDWTRRSKPLISRGGQKLRKHLHEASQWCEADIPRVRLFHGIGKAKDWGGFRHSYIVEGIESIGKAPGEKKPAARRRDSSLYWKKKERNEGEKREKSVEQHAHTEWNV